MHKLIMGIGIPGCGKSAYFEHVIKKTYKKAKIISRDKIRFSLVKEDEPFFSKETLVHNTFVKEILSSIKKNEVTIADATHINPQSRAKILHRIPYINDYFIIGYFFNCPLEIALNRNELRKETREYTPPQEIRRMYDRLVPPAPEEGFDSIEIIKW